MIFPDLSLAQQRRRWTIVVETPREVDRSHEAGPDLKTRGLGLLNTWHAQASGLEKGYYINIKMAQRGPRRLLGNT